MWYQLPIAFVIGFAVQMCYSAGSSPNLRFGMAKVICTMVGSLLSYYYFYR